MAVEPGEGCPERMQPGRSRDTDSEASAVGEDTRLAFVWVVPGDSGGTRELERATGNRVAEEQRAAAPGGREKKAGEWRGEERERTAKLPEC